MTKIKICGFRSVRMAEEAVRAGAHFIGIVCHPASKRYVDRHTAREIAQAVLAIGGIPVAVFVDHSASEMLTFCQYTGIEVIQLHGANARREHPLLPKHYQRIYACSIDEASIILEDLIGLTTCDPQRDYVLFDAKQAGSGQPFAWEKLDYTGPFRMGIAGGVSAANVAEAIAYFHPALVDVSSKVERTPGEKDRELIKAFCRSVQSLTE